MKKKDRNTDNCIQWRLSRGWREALGMLSWHLTSNKGNTAEAVANNRVIARLSPWHQNHNTTRGLTPGRKDPRVSRDAPGNWVSWPTSKGGKGWGKAKIASFMDKVRKMPGPRKKKATEDADADGQDPDEQLEATDSELEIDDEDVEQPVSSNSAYSRPSSSSSGRAQTGLQHVQYPTQSTRQQHGSGPRLTQHQMGQATQGGNPGVLPQGFNNHRPQSRPSALPTTRRSNPLTQRFPSSSNQPHQAALSNTDVSRNELSRGAKRQVHELDMEEDMPSQQQAKKPRVQPSQATNRTHLSFDEIVAGMPDATTMFHKHKAENPHLYTKEALAARKLRLGIPDVSAATFIEQMTEKYIKGRLGYAQPAEGFQNRNMASSDQPAESKSSGSQELASGPVVQNAGGTAPHSRREIDELPGSNQQSTRSTLPVSSATSTAYYPQNLQPYVTAPRRAPVGRAAFGTVPPTVGTKRQFGTLNTDEVPAPHQQVKKARHSGSQDTKDVSLSAEVNAAELKFWNESHANRPMIATPSSQPAPNPPQVDRRQSDTPSSGLGSSHATRPVLRNSQGQNFVNPAGQNTPMSSAGTGSSSSQLMARPSTHGYFGIPLPGSREDIRAPATADKQAHYNSRSQIGSADGYINPALLNNPIPSNVTKSAEISISAIESQTTDTVSATSNDAPNEDFNLDIFDPGPITENTIVPHFPAFPELITMQSQLEPGSEGPMTAFLNADDFDFQMPEMGPNGEL